MSRLEDRLRINIVSFGKFYCRGFFEEANVNHLGVYFKNTLRWSVSKMEKKKLCKNTRFKQFYENREHLTCLCL